MRYFKIILNIVFIILSLYACDIETDEKDNKDTGTPIDSIPPSDTCLTDTCYKCELYDTAALIYNALLDAYNNSCISCLEQILIDWKNKYHENLDIPDSFQDVFDVYKEFYSPWDLARISDSEFGHDIYKGVSYYIIQKSIGYDFNFRTYGDEPCIIKDFRPSIANDSINLLYLNSDYEDAINCFLGSDYAPVGTGNIMNPAFPIGESYERYLFLHNFLKFFHGHWGNYWHLETHPEVHTISFNNTKDSAQVRFRLGYQGGDVILGKENNSWHVVDHYMTWIE